MSKRKSVFVCTECGATSPKWVGCCPGCQAWNTLIEEVPLTAPSGKLAHYAGSTDSAITALSDVELTDTVRLSTGQIEFDRVLGGGLVGGSVVLIGGDPGIGKSTLLLQTLCQLSQQQKALYVTGEESLQQVALRAKRLGLAADELQLLTETRVEKIVEQAEKEKAQVLVVDSIQTVFTDVVQSAPGSVSQVRESAARLVRLAKQSGIALFLVGHVTKDGALAGPRVLEHMVDTVLYFEGERDSRFRILRAIKNRFGAVNELGIFGMTEHGLKQINNPSAIFLSRGDEAVPGSSIMVTWEGSRPLLVEVQALVDQSHLGNPRRVSVGLDQNRLSMLLAVLHRHGGIASYDQDVFVNVVGGVRVAETAADLALLFAVISSLRNRPLPRDCVILGEVGLAGEIRPVPHGVERLHEAEKHGFKQALVSQANAPKSGRVGELKVMGVQRLSDALTCLWD